LPIKNCDDNNGSRKKIKDKTRTHKTNKNKTSHTKQKKIAENKHQERSVVHQWYTGTGHGRQQRKQTQSWRNYSSSSSSRRGGEKKDNQKQKAKTKTHATKLMQQKLRNKKNSKSSRWRNSFSE
jgi:hypothetical protein